MDGVINHVYLAYIYLYLSWLNINQQYGINLCVSTALLSQHTQFL